MKKLLLCPLFCCFTWTVHAQNINKIEYFIDADPGYGTGIDVPITTNSPVTANFNVSLTNSTNGFHFLSIRAKDTNGNWSVVGVRPFYKETLLSEGLPDIVAIEYFIDTDPVYGSGMAVSFTSGPNPAQSFTIPLPNTINDGFHFLSIRAKDANNKWSVVTVRPFYKETLSSEVLPNIVAMEYFIDADPVYGNGTSVNVSAGTPVTNLFDVNLNQLANGTHKLTLRVRDVNNRWSIVGSKDFVIQGNFTLVGALPNTGWCRSTALSVPFTAVGNYNAGNIFTAQLSDNNGNFNSPVTLGTISGTASGSIPAAIPNSVPLGSGYQIRVISSNPSITNSPSKSLAVLSVCPPPCPPMLTLQNNITDNITTGNAVREVAATGGTIVASNVISGTNTTVIYRAGGSITLNAGFLADRGVVFQTQQGGCN
ncbi:MAG: hypothetical protein U0X91_13460 [Spirosomataceae bacterium]